MQSATPNTPAVSTMTSITENIKSVSSATIEKGKDFLTTVSETASKLSKDIKEKTTVDFVTDNWKPLLIIVVIIALAIWGFYYFKKVPKKEPYDPRDIMDVQNETPAPVLKDEVPVARCQYVAPEKQEKKEEVKLEAVEENKTVQELFDNEFFEPQEQRFF